MIVHKCDICKKEMDRWFIVSVEIGVIADYLTFSDLMQRRGRKEYCESCFERIFDNVKKE